MCECVCVYLNLFVNIIIIIINVLVFIYLATNEDINNIPLNLDEEILFNTNNDLIIPKYIRYLPILCLG